MTAASSFDDCSYDMCCGLLRLHSPGVADECASGLQAVTFSFVHNFFLLHTNRRPPEKASVVQTLHARLRNTPAYYVVTCSRLYTLTPFLTCHCAIHSHF